MALIKPLHADFELTENECLFGMYQAFQKCIPLYFAPSLSMKCTVASCDSSCIIANISFTVFKIYT